MTGRPAPGRSPRPRQRPALAAALEVPVRVAGALIDKLAVPVMAAPTEPFANRPAAPPSGPRSGPRNLAFADGLDGWDIGGSSRAEVTWPHWNDHTVAAADGAAALSAAVPRPHGDVFLRQSWICGDYQGATVTLRAEVSAQDVADSAELSRFIVAKTEQPSRKRGARAVSCVAACACPDAGCTPTTATLRPDRAPPDHRARTW